MFSIPHLIIIFVVALVVFGPEKLPELARNLGKVMAEFRRATGDLRSTFEGHLRDIEREADARRIAPPAAAAPHSSPPGTVPSTPPRSVAPPLEGPPVAEGTGIPVASPESSEPSGPHIEELYVGNPKVHGVSDEPYPSPHASTEHSGTGPLPN
jgi:sec-independent protein translocase protein TatB